MGTLRLDVLGPLAASRDGAAIPLGQGKRALLLALLLVEEGRLVPRGRLIDALWDERPPESAVTALHGLVSQLRRLLEDEGAIRTSVWQVLVGSGAGYAISVPDGTTDASRFHAHLTAAREAGGRDDHAGALREIDAALALWRGRPLLGLAAPQLDAFVERCESTHLDALEARADALLGLGRPDEALATVEPVVAAHPERERLRAAQVVALYRCGRQIDALDALTHARGRLRDELGLAPSPMLDELERRVLNHDPSLGSVGAPADPLHRRRLRRTMGAMLGATAIVVAAALGFASWRSPGDSGHASVSEGGVAIALDSSSGKVRVSFPVGAAPVGLAVDDGAIWTLNAGDTTVTRIDADDGTTRTIGTGATPIDLAAADGRLWVANGSRTDAQFVGPVVTSVSRLDAADGSTLFTTGLPRRRALTSNAERQHIVATRNAIFVIGADYAVSRLAPRSGAITARTVGVRATAIAIGPLGLWALEPTGLVRIDPVSARVLDRIPLASPNLNRLAVGARSVWVTDPAAGTLWRVDPGGIQPSASTIALDPGIDAVAVGGDAVWVTNPERHELIRLAAGTGRIQRRIPLAGPPLGVEPVGSLVWVTVGQRNPSADDSLAAACKPMIYGGSGSPDALIVSDLPMGGGFRLPTGQMAAAIAFMLRSHHYRAGRTTIGYRACDDRGGATTVFDPSTCGANGRAYADAPAVLAVIGPYNSGCALRLIPPTNAARGGPLAVISPTATSTDLTRTGPTTAAGLPGSLYPTGVRSFVRLVPTEDAQGAALAREARTLGATRVAVVTGGAFGETISRAFEASAARRGLRVLGPYHFDPAAAGYAPLVREVARAHPEAILVAGLLDENAGAVIRELRRSIPRSVPILGSDGLLPISALFARAGPAARGVHVSLPGLDTRHVSVTGRAFMRAFGASVQEPVDQAAVYAAAATELALDAIARSPGTRASVLAALRHTPAPALIGVHGVDANGDVEPQTFTIVRAARPGGSDALLSVDGAAWERVISP